MGILHGAEMTLSYILHSIFRLIQIVLALAVCGLYGVDLNRADKEHKYSDGKWVCLPLPSPLAFPPPKPNPEADKKSLRRYTQKSPPLYQPS